jgi:hypothetical protein
MERIVSASAVISNLGAGDKTSFFKASRSISDLRNFLRVRIGLRMVNVFCKTHHLLPLPLIMLQLDKQHWFGRPSREVIQATCLKIAFQYLHKLQPLLQRFNVDCNYEQNHLLVIEIHHRRMWARFEESGRWT